MSELLASLSVLGIVINSLFLATFQNTISYEQVPMFEPTPKSSCLTIMQHQPSFAIVYIICFTVLLCSGMCILVEHIKKKK